MVKVEEVGGGGKISATNNLTTKYLNQSIMHDLLSSATCLDF